MKWVYIGLAQAVFFGFLGYYFEKKAGRPTWPPVAGVAIAGSLLWFQYDHAKRSGLSARGPGTETY
ncbi:MAG TPA: hypothetical protein VGR89_03085 [Puia sp.]|nr:hypothetical protein [Puia sp.]